MSIPADTARVSIQGLLPSGEEFDTSFWLRATGFTSQAEVDAAATAIAGLWTPAARAQLYAALGTDSSFQRIKIYAYPAGGPLATWMAEADFATKPGTGTLSDMPLQSSVVVSLRTALIGRRARGRMYFPMVNTTLVVNQLDTTAALNIANQMADFFTDVNALVPDVGNVCVVSSVGTTAEPVTHVVVDTRVDIQRRRAASQAVTGSSTATVS